MNRYSTHVRLVLVMTGGAIHNVRMVVSSMAVILLF